MTLVRERVDNLHITFYPAISIFLQLFLCCWSSRYYARRLRKHWRMYVPWSDSS